MIARLAATAFAFAIASAPLAAMADLYVNLTDLRLSSHQGNCTLSSMHGYHCTYKGELTLKATKGGNSSHCVVSFWPSSGSWGSAQWHYNFTSNDGREASWTNSNTLSVKLKPKAESCGKRC